MHSQVLQRASLLMLAIPVMLGAFFGLTSRAYAADSIDGAYFVDEDNDGTVDHAEYIFDENIDQCNFELEDWTIDTAGSIGIIAITGINTSGVESPGSGTCNGTDGRVYLTVTTTPNVTGGSVAPVISYINQGTLGSLSGVTTANISGQTAALTDWVAPTIASVSPADESIRQSRTQNIVITFSEPMQSAFLEGTQFTISPDPGSFTAEWSIADTVLTLNGPNFTCNRTYTVTTDDVEMDAAGGAVGAFNVNGVESGDWSFTTRACSTGIVTAPTPNPSIVITSPTVDASLAAGSTQAITWDTVSGGGFATLWYSSDNGANYVQIVRNTSDDGAYSWTVPTEATEQALILVEITDLATVLASDSSDVFSVTTDASTADDSEQTETVIEDVEETEAVEGVQPYTYIVGTSFDTVYYLDGQLLRHPFLNERIFFTWQTDFAEVQTVPDATLALLQMGSPMLPKPGEMLVKIDSDPSVYAVESNPANEFSPLLRKIDSEAIAAALYGSDWATRVMDVPVTLFPRYSRGTAITSTP